MSVYLDFNKFSFCPFSYRTDVYEGLVGVRHIWIKLLEVVSQTSPEPFPCNEHGRRRTLCFVAVCAYVGFSITFLQAQGLI